MVLQAACLAYQEGRDDLVETVIAPAAAEAAASLLSRALEDRKRVSKYLDRLKEASTAATRAPALQSACFDTLFCKPECGHACFLSKTHCPDLARPLLEGGFRISLLSHA